VHTILSQIVATVFLTLPPLLSFATDFPNVIYRTCYDGDTCRFGLPKLHPLFGKNIPVRLVGIDSPERQVKM